MERSVARGVAQWLSASALGAESRGFDPRRPDHFLPGSKPAPKSPRRREKHRPQINLHDVFPFGSFPPVGRRGFLWGLPCASRPPACDAHARFASIPAAPTIFCPAGKNGQRSRKASLHCAERDFTQKPRGFSSHLHPRFVPPCLLRRSLRSLVKALRLLVPPQPQRRRMKFAPCGREDRADGAHDAACAAERTKPHGFTSLRGAQLHSKAARLFFTSSPPFCSAAAAETSSASWAYALRAGLANEAVLVLRSLGGGGRLRFMARSAASYGGAVLHAPEVRFMSRGLQNSMTLLY